MNPLDSTERVDSSAAEQANRVFNDWCDFRHFSLAARQAIRAQCLSFFAMGVEWGRQHPGPRNRDADDFDYADEGEEGDGFA